MPFMASAQVNDAQIRAQIASLLEVVRELQMQLVELRVEKAECEDATEKYEATGAELREYEAETSKLQGNVSGMTLQQGYWHYDRVREERAADHDELANAHTEAAIVMSNVCE